MSITCRSSRLGLLFLSFLFSASLSSQVRVDSLRTEYLDRPLGLDEAQPRFSWQLLTDGDARGIQQAAYRIRVSGPGDTPAWDSGRREGARALNIAYEGERLLPKTRYSWSITVWDQDNREHQGGSWFETGLLDTDPDSEGWKGAAWIGGGPEDLQLYSHYLSVFQLDFGLQLDEASRSTRAAFLIGANDPRLMDADRNLQGVASGRDGHYISFELDISGLETADGLAKLHVYRVGYARGDSPETPFKTLDIPRDLLNPANQYAPHRVFLKSNFGIFQVYLDGEDEAHEISKAEGGGGPFGPQGFNLNPVGPGNNYISFPMLADIGLHLHPGQQATFTGITVRNYREPANILFREEPGTGYSGLFSDHLSPAFRAAPAGLMADGGEEGLLLTADPSHSAAPMLRRAFILEDKPIARARVYATARGIYELHLNGNRVGDYYFTPGLTQYNRHHQYQVYDVADQLQAGSENVLGGWLSEGWWSGNITYSGENWNFFGDRPSLRALLEVTYQDGTQTTVATEPESWKLFTEGPLRYGSYFQGEVYDARLEAGVSGWSAPGYDASAWRPAVEVPLEGTTFPGLDYANLQLIGQIGLPPAIVKTLEADSMEEVRPGVFVYDMGQNMVGFPEIRIRDGQAGDTVLLRYAEVRYPELPEYAGNEGMVMMENIRAALTQDLYILKGGDEVIRPRFTFHGYRFMELSGVGQAPAKEDVKGLVVSSIRHLDSHYETSDPLVNRFWENITWSLRANFLSIPTDTPARNERMGWSGDINVFSQAATYLAGVAPFLSRHLLAMRDIQREDGRFTDVAPVGGGFGGTLWGSAGMILPWEVYLQYGDTRILEDHYDAMAQYLDFLDSRIDPETGRLEEGPLGDWLSPEGSKNDNSLLWAAYHAYDLKIMAEIASLLDKGEDASRYQQRYEERKAYFNKTYVDPETHRTIHSGFAGRMFGPPPPGYESPEPGDLVDTQASYAIPLNFGIFNREHEGPAAVHLSETVRRGNPDDTGVQRPAYSLMTGFIGTASINHALSRHGYDADAYRLLRQRDYPSWLYPVVNGATTIWERLNSYTVEDGFGGNNSMNSFNHYSFGAVASWMYNHSLGIQRDPAHPGFQHFILAPTPDPDGELRFARGHYDSPYGRIESSWQLTGDGVDYAFTVPPNSRATLILDAVSAKQITEGGRKLKRSKGISGIAETAGQVRMELASGNYRFRVAE
ncbi:alpha-L-rhamnosidase [Robiginitalea sp. SC105]|uniref:alpha-L-rhamnosidase n=1 Tax=Robiginitalea sp. SC105 TaxID=2762332 RepID=UPI00163AB42C|nr:alpha-L-rhamnosidase [Robiginitalea sp. SC105]MBC2839319.1 family 78 glycoside hydrolase catalytic domain [Robiginitalea sp. SC105]